MRRKLLFATLAAALLTTSAPAYAYWMWSPDIGKWINPKKSAKDTPEEQYSWAMEFYNNNQWDRAIEEFEKIPQVFPNSRLAAEGVFYAGMAWEQKGDIAKAADDYQRLIDHYPYSDRIKDAIKHEYDIAGQFANGARMKVLGMPILSGQDKAIDLYKHIVKNAPFGSYGDHAQYQIGEVYKMQGDYDSAQKAFQTVVDEYPTSELVSQARYQVAYCSMQASKAAQYTDQSTQKAIEEFQGFKEEFPENKRSVEADESIKTLREKQAEASFNTAAFYEKQKKWPSAKVYYQEVVSKYSDTSFAAEAKKRLDAIAQSESAVPDKGRGFFHLW